MTGETGAGKSILVDAARAGGRGTRLLGLHPRGRGAPVRVRRVRRRTTASARSLAGGVGPAGFRAPARAPRALARRPRPRFRGGRAGLGAHAGKPRRAAASRFTARARSRSWPTRQRRSSSSTPSRRPSPSARPWSRPPPAGPRRARRLGRPGGVAPGAGPAKLEMLEFQIREIESVGPTESRGERSCRRSASGSCTPTGSAAPGRRRWRRSPRRRARRPTGWGRPRGPSPTLAAIDPRSAAHREEAEDLKRRITDLAAAARDAAECDRRPTRTG